MQAFGGITYIVHNFLGKICAIEQCAQQCLKRRSKARGFKPNIGQNFRPKQHRCTDMDYQITEDVRLMKLLIMLHRKPSILETSKRISRRVDISKLEELLFQPIWI